MSPESSVSTVDGTALPSPLFTNPSRLKLGVFHMNCTRGATPTLAEGSIDHLNWAQQVRIARVAEAAGLDALIPIARWRGYGGPSHFNDEQYEAMPWAGGIAASTSKIAIFATAHVPLLHPARAAKEVATVDHIANGRFCLNIVAGWNTAEFDMFGVAQQPHDERYRVAGEWVTLLKRLWASDEEFDFAGDYYQGTGLISRPKPISQPRPPIMSAGSSEAGREFAATHADVCFAAADNPADLGVIAHDIKERAKRKGREVAVWAQAGAIFGETEAEVRKKYDHFVHEKGDWEAVGNQMDMLLGGGGQTLNFEQSKPMLERMIAMQSGYPLYGTPEQVVEKMGALVDAGIDGLSVIWMDYERGIQEYDELVRPVAVDAGLRAG